MMRFVVIAAFLSVTSCGLKVPPLPPSPEIQVERIIVGIVPLSVPGDAPFCVEIRTPYDAGRYSCMTVQDVRDWADGFRQAD